MTRAIFVAAILTASVTWAAPAGRRHLAPVENQDSSVIPAEAQHVFRRAMAAMTSGDLAAAKKDFRIVLALVPGNIPTTINLGLIEYRQRNFAEAESWLKKVTRAEPENALGWLLLGITCHDQDKLDAALAALAQAVLFAPKDARAHHYLGVVIGKKGWYQGAEDEMRKAITLDPDYDEAHYNLAVFYLQRNPPAVELARRHYYKSRDLGGPPDPEIERRLAAPSP